MTTWLAPESLEEALELRAEHGGEATVLAGGTFLGILMNQGFLAPETLLSLGRVHGLDGIEVVDGELRLGAMATHRAVERSAVVREGWPCSPVRSRSWRARACATRRRWAASSPTPTTPRTRRPC